MKPGLGPVHVGLGLVLPVFKHAVGVEHGRVAHLLDEGGRGGGHVDPAQCGYALRDSRKVIEEFGPVFTEID